MIVYYWPDGIWDTDETFNENDWSWKDDFASFHMPEGSSEEEIEIEVRRRNS